MCDLIKNLSGIQKSNRRIREDEIMKYKENIKLKFKYITDFINIKVKI